MKTNVKLCIYILIFILIACTLPMAAFAESNSTYSLPSCSYPYCPNCGTASLVFVDERYEEITYSGVTCVNSSTPHKHAYFKYYNDYYCSSCGISCTEHTSTSHIYCEVSWGKSSIGLQ